MLELEERLVLLSQASLRVNENLDFDTVLRGSWTPLAPSPAPATASH